MIESHSIRINNGAFSIKDVSFQIPEGAYGVLMGRTGSGKTTLLEGICGLLPIVSGNLMLGGRDVTNDSPAQRQIGLVPQDGSLFEHLNVRDHLGFALRIRKVPNRDIQQRVSELAELLQLESLLTRKPWQLSGGERQRVALGRALSFKPAVLCLDEPLSALDEVTRCDMINILRHVQAQTKVTTLHVTHLASEARELADVLLTIDEGALSAAPTSNRS